VKKLFNSYIFLGTLLGVSLFLFYWVITDNLEVKSSSDTFYIKPAEVYSKFKLSFTQPFFDDIKATNTTRKLPDFNNVIKNIKDLPGSYSLYIKDLNVGSEYVFNEKETYYAASLYKIPIGVAVLREIQEGNINYGDGISFLASDHIRGTGRIGDYSYGTNFTTEELLNFLYRDSDNSAQAMILRKIPQPKIYEAFTFYQTKSELNSYYHTNIATVIDVSVYLENILAKEYLNDDFKEKFLSMLYPTSFDNRISSYLDKNLIFAHKIGSWPASWHDCGYVYDKNSKNNKVLVCLMTKDTNLGSLNNACRSIGEFVSGLF